MWHWTEQKIVLSTLAKWFLRYVCTCISKIRTVYRGIIYTTVLNRKGVPAEVSAQQSEHVVSLETGRATLSGQSGETRSFSSNKVATRSVQEHTTRSSLLMPSGQWVSLWTLLGRFSPSRPTIFLLFSILLSGGLLCGHACRRGWESGHSFHSLRLAGISTLASTFLSQKWWHTSPACHRAGPLDL